MAVMREEVNTSDLDGELDDDEEGVSAAERKSLPLSVFAWPEKRKYPITSQDRLDSAATLIGHAPASVQAAIKARAKAIAKEKGFNLPDTWKDEQQAESAATVTSSVIKPRQKIATLRVCFLEYNARSLNGRIYPKVTCDRIYASAVRKLADPNGLPVTCFVSHEAANGNVNTELVGRAVKVWQEGSKFYADLDLADTRTAWDMLALAEGGYMRSESMRVLGVELLHDRNYDVPLVVVQEGVEPELMGIDLTTRPGLMDTARIQQVLYEAAKTPPFTETFALESIAVEKGTDPMPHIPLYKRLIAEHMDPQAHQKVHDHIAGVLDATIKECHGGESARLVAAVESELSEEGRALAQKHAVPLAAAHDIAAHHAGLSCEGAYNDALGISISPDTDGPIDPDGDGDVHKTSEGSSPRKGDTQPMALTEQQIQEALQEAAKRGYTVAPPKTSEEKMQESFDAKLAEQDRKWEERLKTLAPAPITPPQRQTQSLGGLTEGDPAFQPEPMYMEGDYLQGPLHPKNWKALANRRVPWPISVDPNQALFELAPFMEYTIMAAQEAARGRSLRDMIASGEVQ